MSTDKKTFFLVDARVKAFAKECIDQAPDDWVCIIQKKTRTLAQNAAMWGRLTDISEQVEWYGRKLDEEDWKHIFTAALKKQDVVPNLDGSGFVVLGKSTKKMNVSEMKDLIELMNAFAAERGVKFKEKRYEGYDHREGRFVA